MKNEKLPSATTWMDMEGIKLMKSDRKIPYVTTYTWNLKNKTNNYKHNKTERDSQIQRTN